MRVVHLGKFYPSHRGGIESHLELLCRGLGRALEVEVIVANGSNTTVVEDDRGVAVRRLACIGNFRSAPLCPTIVREIRRVRADLIHLHMPNPLVAIAFLLICNAAPLFVSWHSDILRQRLLGRLIAPLQRIVVGCAAALIASSPNYLDGSPTLASNRSRVQVIPYGIDQREFARPHDYSAVAAIRRRYGERIVLAVGRLVYYKGFDYLIRAMREVDGRLLIVGEGPLQASLKEAAAAADVSDRVHFLGDLDRPALIDHYHAADIFTLPSIARSEAFGIVQLEAMAAGKPIINTRLDSGVPFVSRDGETGLTVEARSAPALAQALNRLFANPELRARFGAAAAQRVAREFNAELMVNRTLELYRQVLARSPMAPRLVSESRTSDTASPRSSRQAWRR